MKPHSNICPNIAIGVFKWFLSRALHICSDNYLAQEIEFLINVTKEYMNNITPMKEKVNIETIKNNKIVKLPWVPKLGPKLRKEFQKFGIKTLFTLGRNLKNLICRNKSKLLPNIFSSVYQLYCTCSALYIVEIKKKVITRTIEHQQDSFKGK